MGLEALLGTDDARSVVEIMARMPGAPGLRKAALRYVGLFAPNSQRLRWGRVEKLLGELTTMMESGRIERNGRTWPAPLDYWQAALDAVLANTAIRRPLKGHGYLLEVLAGLANKAEGVQEAKAEETKQHVSQTRGKQEVTTVGRAVMPADIQSQLRQFTGKEGTSDGNQA